MIQVHNKNNYKGYGVCVHRPNILGNPYSHLPKSNSLYKTGSREEAINKCERYLKLHLGTNDEIDNEIVRLCEEYMDVGELHLICFCRPKRCHADVIAKIVKALVGKETIDKFDGNFRFLSNFYATNITYNGLRFTSTEAAYQASKCKFFEERELFTTLSPSQSKRLGKNVRIREDWNKIKLRVMYDLVNIKFKKEPLRGKLLDTNDLYLIEGNTWGDNFWGCVRNDKDIWRGRNMLGNILMKVRDEIK